MGSGLIWNQLRQCLDETHELLLGRNQRLWTIAEQALGGRGEEERDGGRGEEEGRDGGREKEGRHG